jgi:hypothetical protein
MRIAASLSPILLLGVAHAQNLPDGKGKQLVEEVCGNCHGLDFVLAEHGNRERWASIANQMLARGVTASDDDPRTIVEYLAKNLPADPPKINVNKATARENRIGAGAERESVRSYRSVSEGSRRLQGLGRTRQSTGD